MRFPVKRVSELAPVPKEQRWLVEGLWADQAVGIVGGEPKSCKSFLALDLAVAVASGAPCLRHFPVNKTGRVLLYAAEDHPHVVRSRLEGIARKAGVDFASLDVFSIVASQIRLDSLNHRQSLQETVETVKPALLVLDPFVRLHAGDENAVSEVAPLLAYLRSLQRRFGTAVLLVHHARKGAGNARAGQALRGSSDLHGWGDCNLYLRRKGKDLLLSIEHRAAAGLDSLPLALQGDDDDLALHLLDPHPTVDEHPPPTPPERIQSALAQAAAPLTVRQLREAAKMRTQNLCQALHELVENGHVIKEHDGYRLPTP
jgi:hypothetical protein